LFINFLIICRILPFLTCIFSKAKRGRPRKRSLEVQILIDAFGKLTKSQIDALDNTTWSSKSSCNTPTVWDIMCSNLKMKANGNNKKWLAHVWQSNMWSIADEVRKYVRIHELKSILSVIFHITFFYWKGIKMILPMILPLLISMQYQRRLLKNINIIILFLFQWYSSQSNRWFSYS